MSAAPTSRALADWLGWLEAQRPQQQIELGLDRIRRVKDELGIGFACPVILVGGTNGKGSTCAFLEAILLQSGYRVGLHTSPHLLRFNERARINGESADDDALVVQFEAVEAARAAVAAREGEAAAALTYFEFTGLAIMRLFQHSGLDAAIFEIGLGGRLDAMNVLDADCSIVTSIDIDHAEWLGDTRDEIGREKAHIFRTGRPAICSDPMPPQSLLDHAREIDADLRLFGRDFNYAGQRGPTDWQQWSWGGRAMKVAGLAYPALRGANQLLNASGALAALEALRPQLPVNNQAIRNGFALVELPGRFQVLPGKPTIVLDVAHNPHAAAALADNLDHMAFHPYTYAVFGCMRDKDIAGVVARMKGRIDHWHVTSLPLERAATGEEIAAVLRAQGFPEDREHSITVHATPAAAWVAARGAAGEGDRILVFGSFLTVGGVMDLASRSR
ncbi:bifunctional tetrahydrofolate synthase/dihydrofolate synthase [Derxia lacustris]|uniref:bifunctional tetrahydrofolate synthase/dihydrofolate synthase n=1 Tax=Derxia lacustris TaxID=764842 RepID=UPI000A16D30C|nr:bifunctional tetrahydrofolate synthase/dihydrofolate synthase [Derxia lacustris]